MRLAQQLLTPERVGIGVVAFLIIVMIALHTVESRARSKGSRTNEFGHADLLILIGLILVVVLLFYVGSDVLHGVVAAILGIPTSKVLVCHGTWTAIGFAYNIVVGALFVLVALLLIGLDEILASAFMPRERIRLLASGIFASSGIVLAVTLFMLLMHVLGQPLVTLPAC